MQKDMVTRLFMICFLLLSCACETDTPSWWKHIKNGNSKKMAELLTSGKLNIEERYENCTPLAYATACGRYDIAKMLVAAGANVNVTKGTMTPLQYAILAGEHSDFYKTLLKKGADPNYKTASASPLWLVTSFLDDKKIDIIKLLIEYGAEVDYCASDGTTPLMQAISQDQNQIAILLITKGANIGLVSAYGKSAISIAREHKNIEIESLLISKAEGNADLNCESPVTDSP